MESFKDYFSKQSDIYAKYRPLYPRELFVYVASLTQAHEKVWDCGTGNGQAAVSLAEFFTEVIATDPSKEQIKNATQHPRVNYFVEKAESTFIESASLDLVTVANALHWFTFDAFYNEVRRVLKPGGVLAAWCYEVPQVSKDIDKILRYLHDVILNNYWKAENRLVEKLYTTIPFPFTTIESPPFFSTRQINFEELVGYLNTWSAVQRCINETSVNPLSGIYDDLASAWGDTVAKRTVTWQLALKVGKV